MTKEITPGTLCLVIGAHTEQGAKNIGKSVIAQRYGTPEEGRFWFLGKRWNLRNPSWICTGENLTSRQRWAGGRVEYCGGQSSAAFDPKFLLPIPPRALIEDNEEVKEIEK